MVNMKIDYFRKKKKINESNLRHVEFELLTNYLGGAGYAVQEIRRRLRLGGKNKHKTNKISTERLNFNHHSNKMRNFAKIM